MFGLVDSLPAHRAVLAVIGHLPDASRCLHQRLLAVVVELQDEVIDRRVLVQIVGLVNGIRATLGREFTIPDVVELVGVAVGRINRSRRVRQFASRVVAVVVGVGRVEGRTGMSADNAAACGVVGVGVLRDRAAWKRVVDLKQFATIAVGPTGGEAVRIREGLLQVAAGQIVPGELFDWSIVRIVRLVRRNGH